MVNTTFFLIYPAAAHIYTLSLHDALPIFPNDITCTVNKTGTYTVIVRDSTGTFSGDRKSASLNPSPTASSYAVACGATPLAGSMSVAGELDCFAVTGTVGDQLRVRVVETS